MIWIQLTVLLGMWLVASWAPGWALVRRLPWRADERFCFAIAVSLFLYYLAAAVGFALNVSGSVYWVGTAIAFGAAVWTWRSFTDALRRSCVRRLVYVYGLAAIWAMLCLTLIRHYSGGIWAVDWYLHYEKVDMFLHGFPNDPQVIRERLLDRPPMANLIAAFFTGQVGLRFETFECLFDWMNLLPVIPACMMLTMFSRRGGRRWPVFIAILVCVPSFWANATWTWNKLLAAFYILTATWLYLRAIRRERSDGRLYAAVGCFAAGVIVHYIVLPFAVLALGHYLIFIWRRRPRRGRELATIAVLWTAILCTWFPWLFLRYGVSEMSASNYTMQYARKDKTIGVLTRKMARNVVWTIFPHPMRMSTGFFDQKDRPAFVRDYAFLIYQHNGLFVAGSVTAIVAAATAYRRLRPRRPVDRVTVACAVSGMAAFWALAMLVPPARNVIFDLFPRIAMFAVATAAAGFIPALICQAVRGESPKPSPETWFWRMFIPYLPIAAGVTHDYLVDYGLAHNYFHAWTLLAVALVAVTVPTLNPWVRRVLVVGMLTDFALGVWLQMWVEHRVFPLLPGGFVDLMGMARHAGLNYLDKIHHGFTFVGDHTTALAVPAAGLLIVGALMACAIVLRAGRREDSLTRV